MPVNPCVGGVDSYVAALMKAKCLAMLFPTDDTLTRPCIGFSPAVVMRPGTVVVSMDIEMQHMRSWVNGDTFDCTCTYVLTQDGKCGWTCKRNISAL
jgi:hypothetical protein